MNYHSNRLQQAKAPTRRKILMILGGIVVVICAVIVFTLLKQPGRSIANFCQVAKEQKTILIDDVNYEQRLEAYKKLEVVSPDEIKPDITTIRKGYEAIVQDPSSTLSTGFGISGAENRRTDFINQNCSDF